MSFVAVAFNIKTSGVLALPVRNLYGEKVGFGCQVILRCEGDPIEVGSKLDFKTLWVQQIVQISSYSLQQIQ